MEKRILHKHNHLSKAVLPASKAITSLTHLMLILKISS